MLFYFKRPKNNSGANYPRDIKFWNSGLVATQYYEKNSGLSALFQYAPIYGHVNADGMLFYLKRPKPGNNSGANYPRDIKFCTRTQVWWLHNIMKRIPVFLRYFKICSHLRPC